MVNQFVYFTKKDSSYGIRLGEHCGWFYDGFAVKTGVSEYYIYDIICS